MFRPSLDHLQGTFHANLVQVKVGQIIKWITIKWDQLPAGLLAPFPCKTNTFRKRVRNVVTGWGIEVWIECK